MSHFSVLVIGDNVEEKMAPYQENNNEDCPKQYLQFYEVEEEYRKEYEKKKVKMVRLPDGSLVYPWDRKYCVNPSIGISSRDKFKFPAGSRRVNIPFTEKFATFEEFMDSWHGYKERDEVIGRYGRWENPNAKWDWYSIGGRWAGKFKIREGRTASVGEKSWTHGNRNPYEGGKADQARYCDIDWENMTSQDRISNLKLEWEVAMGIVNMSDGEKIRKFGLMYKKEWYIEKYQCVDNFIRLQTAFHTFAVIDENGKWYDEGKMGWFGMSSATPGRELDWEDYYHTNFIAPLAKKPETLLTIVDCHI